LRGEFALSDSPADADFDLAWGEGGVQQVWGLGVPAWRLPFELLARLVGQSPFPDRLAFMAAVTVLSYILLRTFVVSGTPRGLGEFCDAIKRSPLRLISLVALLLFPPMLTLLGGRVLVYEEAAAYAYLFSIALFTGLVAFWRQPTMMRFLCLSLFSGLVGFTRLPSLAYGLATVVMALAVTRRLRWPWWKSFTGIGLFGFGGLLLLWTNWLRFGAPMEFGYALQLNLMYELRFPAAYSQEPIGPAAKELFGSLFLGPDLNGTRYLDSGIVPGQSSAPRWRNFYHTTFDASYLVLLLLFWGLMLWRCRRRLVAQICNLPYRRIAFCGGGVVSKRATILPQPADCKSAIRPIANLRYGDAMLALAALWSLLSFIPLVAFYLRSVAISSRYMLDFAPAIAVGVGGLVLCLGQIAESSRNKRAWMAMLLTGAGLWWGYEIATAQHETPGSGVLLRHELPASVHNDKALIALPGAYRADVPEKYGIPKNRQGWRNENGETGSLVILFVDDPTEIRLEMEAGPDAKLTPEDYPQIIQVKVGWEPLKLQSIVSEGAKQVLTFAEPRRAAFRHGVQVLFIGLAGPDDFTEPQSRFRLLSVSWKKQDGV